jgi:hypothetical protein
VDGVRRWGPLLGWLGSLAAGIVLFTALGGGALEAPPLGQPSVWGDWAAARDPFVAAAAVLRLVVLALAWYLVAVTTVGLVARLTRAARLVRVADALSVPIVRHVLQGALGLTLAAGVVASSSGAVPATARAAPGPSETAAAAADDDTSRAGMLALDGPGSGEATVSMVGLDDPGAGGTARMVGLDERRDDATARMVGLGPPGASPDASGEDAPEVDPGPEADGASAAAEGEHEVEAGEHLWSIAEDHLAAHLDHDPSEAEVAVHWRRLVEVNRDRLANPDDPDLIFPGQHVVLPEVRPGDTP